MLRTFCHLLTQRRTYIFVITQAVAMAQGIDLYWPILIVQPDLQASGPGGLTRAPVHLLARTKEILHICRNTRG